MGRPRKKQAEGLGDTIENVLEVTGIAKVAKWAMGEDCGCEERKQKLNELWRYKRPECLTENEYEILDSYFSQHRTNVKPSEQVMLLKVYNRVMHENLQQTSCSSCVREFVTKLNKLYIVYKDERNADTTTEQ
jgi:hypothetical protein